MKRPSTTRAVTVVLALVGAALSVHGLWIPAKAHLAQILLQRAWARAVDGETAPKPWPWADTFPVARLRVPGHAVDLIVLAGSSGRSLAFGPGHVSGTALPGEIGNCVLSAHRDTQFRFLERVALGERISLETPDGRTHEYRVTDYSVVDRRAPGVVEPTVGSVLTLVTCYPFDAIVPGGPLRYVVRAVALPLPMSGT